MAETFNERFKRLRTERGLTLEGMAADLGVSWQTIQHWERTFAPKRARLPEVAKLLGVTPEYLLFGETGLVLTGEERRFVLLLRSATRQQRAAAKRALTGSQA